MADLPPIDKSTRVTGKARISLTAKLRREYQRGASIRELADQLGRSYGFVHRILSESGVTLRGRGGRPRQQSGQGGYQRLGC